MNKLVGPCMKIILYNMFIWVGLIRNSNEIEDTQGQESLVHLVLNRIRSLDKVNFINKTDNEKHEIAIVIEKEYHPFGYLFENNKVVDSKYFYKIFDLIKQQIHNLSPDKERPKDKTNLKRRAKEDESNDYNIASKLMSIGNSELLDTPRENPTFNGVLNGSQMAPIDIEKKLEYPDELYFDLLQKGIQLYHFNFVKFLIEKTTYRSLKFQELFFCYFFNKRMRSVKYSRESILKMIYENPPLNEKIENVSLKDDIQIKFDVKEYIRAEVKKLKGIIDEELRTNVNFLREVLKNKQIVRQLLKLYCGKKKMFHKMIVALLYKDSEIVYEKISRNKRLRENIIFYLRRKIDFDNYRYFYVFNDSDVRERISLIHKEKPIYRGNRHG